MAAIVAVMGFAQQAVTPPLTATFETWYITSTMYYSDGQGGVTHDDVAEDMEVAFSDNDVYFKFPNPLNGGAWVKGTKNLDGTYVFAGGQYQGNYDGTDFYFCSTTDGTDVTDVVFSYFPDEQEFYSSNLILMNTSTTTFAPYCYFLRTQVMKQKPVVEQLVEAPEGLTTEEYQLAASSIQLLTDGSIAGMEQVSRSIMIGFQGSDVYVKGLSDMFPESWVKGTLNDGIVTFAANQYLGKLPTGNVYFSGYRNEQLTDLVMYYDAATGRFAGESYYMLINSSKTQFNPYEFLGGIYFNKVIEKAATPANPSVVEYQYDEKDDLAYIVLNVPNVDTNGEPMMTGKLAYKFYVDNQGTVTPYVFSKTWYRDLPEAEMTEIPYSYDDGYDIYFAGSTVYFYENLGNYTRIGVQSIYRGGGAEHSSDIVWFDPNTAGISTVSATDNVVSETWRDLQGRPAGAGAKGLLIRQQRMADGTIRTVKMVRK